MTIAAPHGRPAPHPWEHRYADGVDWREPVPERPLTALLDESAARFPDRPCLEFLGRRTSYRDTARQVERAACGLQAMGVGRGTRVGILMPNCPWFVIGFYAVLKAGGTVVTCNPLAPARELARQIVDSGMEILIVLDAPAFRTTLSAVGWPGRLRALVVARLADALPFPKNWLYPLVRRRDVARYPADGRHVPFARLLRARGTPRPAAPDPRRDPAVLQYTGGTTGVPRGTVLTHAGLHANAVQCARWYTGARPGRERVLAALPFFHAFGLTGVMNFGLALGAELILLPRIDARDILQTIQDKRPGVLLAVPRLFAGLAAVAARGRWDLGSLELCVSGGDTLTPQVQERFERATGRTIAQGYGLTEASPVLTCTPFRGQRKPGSAGLPLPGTVVTILSAEDRVTPLPPRTVGEVCATGPQIMAGYWNDPEATAEALAGGVLHTGDMGYLDEDGSLFIVDRLKDLIVAGGHHVYPRVVEAAIREHPAVAEVAVIGEPDPARGEAVKAFVVPAEGAALTEAQLRAHLEGRLSRFELPQRYEFRDSLPTSTIGKILKRRLRAEAEGGLTRRG